MDVRQSGRLVDPAVPTMSYTQLNRGLPRADWLLLACPLSDATRHMIASAQFAMLASHCGLINVSHGEVIDEPSLVAALREKRIVGAYLDVFAHEPLPVVGLFAPPFGVGYYAACAIGRVDPDEGIGPIMAYLIALFVGLVVVALVPWISIGFL